jgi:hypothetical protein
MTPIDLSAPVGLSAPIGPSRHVVMADAPDIAERTDGS